MKGRTRGAAGAPALSGTSWPHPAPGGGVCTAPHMAGTLWSGGSGRCRVDPPALCQVSLRPSPSSRPAAVPLVHHMVRVLLEPTHPTNPQTLTAPGRGWGLGLGRGGHSCPGAGTLCWVTRTAGTGGCCMRPVLWGELGGRGWGRSSLPGHLQGLPLLLPLPTVSMKAVQLDRSCSARGGIWLGGQPSTGGGKQPSS